MGVESRISGELHARHLLLGGWQMLSYYGRYALLGAFAIVVFWGGWCMRHRILWVKPEGWGWLEPVVATLLLLLGGTALAGVYQARQVPENAVDLAFPLRDGTFYVVSGGGQMIANPHMKVGSPDLEEWRGQLWGLDIVELYPLGNRAKGLYPTTLDRYAIFGSPVYAPCEGTVEQVEEQLPDLTPPSRDTTNKAGNYVMLQCGPEAYVLLAHLQHESVVVQAGDSVSTGTRLGEVGNSGNSSEPHLHVSAQRSLGASTILDADPAPLTFDWAFLRRNDVIQASPD